ncbi:hypothetical protein DUI87_33560 [Hirundo rustica rustica]|uniref:Uncharacterized protein n=1 Tax=Hirundo rustica rustica TaxID=333673 RepID=A0A3M0IU55_HIRRU|nr:hypothetical protein DUI87_33560 [Hirundo rustica rustica]
MREGDLDYQPISITEPLEDAEGPPTGKNKATGQKESLEAKNSRKQIVEERHKGHDWDRSLHFLDIMVNGLMKHLQDAEGKFSVCLSCQNNPCQCGKSSPMCHFPYHDLKAEGFRKACPAPFWIPN